ncbi:MAG: Gfo/Idh/MocA family oxidoreductase, partial [Pseudomonadales bacterium]
MTIRYGLIGSGMMGQEHIRNLNLLDGCEVTAIAEPDLGMRELSQQTANSAIATYSNHHDMLANSDLDAL